MDAEAALQQIAEGLDALLAGGLDPADAAAAAELVRSVEVVARKMQAVQVAVVDVIDGAGLHRHDGHASAKVMVRHLAALSGGEATRRAQAAAVLRDLPETAAAHRAGELGTCQVRRLGRVHANRRVRDRMAGSESFLLTWARDESYRQFDLLVEQWERLVDEDGAGSRDHAHFERRDARMVRDYDGMWTFTAHCDSLTGVHIRDIFGHFTDTEFHTDWTQARRRVGDQVTVSDLARTDAQRRFDAFATMCHQAATTPPGGVEPLVVTNVVIDQASFERQLTRLAGGAVDAIDPHDPTHRCSTLDGEPLDPTTATVTSLLGHVRRVVTGADGVTVDMGRRDDCSPDPPTSPPDSEPPSASGPDATSPAPTARSTTSDHGPTADRPTPPTAHRCADVTTG